MVPKATKYPDLIGKTITGVRSMTDEEFTDESWTRPNNKIVMVIVLDDDTIIYASKDAAGNDPGEIFGVGKKGAFKL